MTVLKQIAIDRNAHTVDRHYFDLYINDEGFGGNFIWKAPAYRFIHSRFGDFLKRQKYKGATPEKAMQIDERSFFVKFEDVQGIVNDDLHKEFQIQTSSELMRILFRNVKNYETFTELMKASSVKEKIFTREGEIKLSVEQGY